MLLPAEPGRSIHTSGSRVLSVDVLLRVYAKCIAGRQEAAKRRIYDATRPLQAPRPAEPES